MAGPWQPYVDEQLIGAGVCNGAALVHRSEGIWAIGGDLTLTDQERDGVWKAFSDPGETRAKGVTVGHNRYMVLDVEEGIITGRKGSSGVILVKTNTLVVVAVYHSPIQPMQAKVNLEHFAEDMKEKGR